MLISPLILSNFFHKSDGIHNSIHFYSELKIYQCTNIIMLTSTNVLFVAYL